MASQNPPVKGQAYSFEMGLVSQSDTNTFQANPTLASGDVVVVKDGTLDGNIDALPVAVTSCTRLITVTLSEDEMNADRIAVLFHDASGSEWQDQQAFITTNAQTHDTVDSNVDAILADTDDIGVAGAGLTAVPWNANWDAEVQSEVQDALVANDLDHLIQVSAGSEEPTDGSYLDQMMHKSAAQNFDASTDSLEAIKDRLNNVAVTATTVTSSEISDYRGDRWSISITSLGDISGRTGEKLYFTVKRDKVDDYDAAALVQVGETTGLIRINGAAAGTAANASITVSDASAGDITIVVEETETAKLPVLNDIYFDVKMVDSNGTKTLTNGTFNILADVTRRSS